MTRDIEISDNVTPALKEMIDRTIPNARQELIHQIAMEVLSQTAQENPVSSGRSRAGWTAAAQQLSGLSSTGTEASGQNGEGTLNTSHDQSTTSVSATNHVPYIAHLEYGTSAMAPFSMLRKSLTGILGRLGDMFQLTR